MELVNWKDELAKGKAEEILMYDAMSSEESSYEDDGGQQKLVQYSVKKLSWESPKMKKIKNRLDKYYHRKLSTRARQRIVPRVVSASLSNREPPLSELPVWAVNTQD